MTEKPHTSRATGRRPRLVIGAEALVRLEALAQGAFQRNPDLADELLEELGRAKIVPEAKLPANVVAIGRPVTYRDESTAQEKTVTPVYPEDADIASGRISIMTPIGVSLIGLAEGATFHWETRDHKRRLLTVLRVGAQGSAKDPEA